MMRTDRDLSRHSDLDLQLREDPPQNLASLLLRSYQRKTKFSLDQSLHLHAGLDGNRARLDQEGLHQWIELVVKRCCRCKITCSRKVHQLSHAGRNYIRGDRDNPAGTY